MNKALQTIIIFLIIAAPIGAIAAGPMDALKAPIDEVISILKDPQYKNVETDAELKAAQRDKLWNVIHPIFDYDFISKSTLGRYHWEKTFSSDQRKTFTDVFSRFLGNTYLDKIQEGYQNEDVNYVAEELLTPAKAVVKTTISGQKTRIPVNYLMRTQDGQWKIYDVNIEGVSLVQNYRSQFSSYLLNNSADQLIQNLKSKL